MRNRGDVLQNKNVNGESKTCCEVGLQTLMQESELMEVDIEKKSDF